jgi:hypothetical protein
MRLDALTLMGFGLLAVRSAVPLEHWVPWNRLGKCRPAPRCPQWGCWPSKYIFAVDSSAMGLLTHALVAICQAPHAIPYISGQ